MAKKWSIADWKCGMDIVKSCKDLKMDWTSDSAFKQVVSEVVPMSQILIVYGAQIIADQLSTNIQRGMNSITCMVGNFGENTWALLAAGYQVGLVLGQKDNLNKYLNMGYGYVCTCSIDAAGIKGMLGASKESSAIFSSCSEGGNAKKLQAYQAKLDLAEAKIDAGLEIKHKAGRDKIRKATTTALGKLTGCGDASKNVSAACRASVLLFNQETDRLVTYRLQQEKAGKIAKNDKHAYQEQTFDYLNIKAVRDSVRTFNKEVFTLTTDKDSIEPCYASGAPTTALYGKNCTSTIKDGFKVNFATLKCAANSFSYACYTTFKDANITANIKCKAGDTGTTEQTGTTKCILVKYQNGFYMWRDATKAANKCRNLANNADLAGGENCFNDTQNRYGKGVGAMTSREYLSFDQPQYRTVGDLTATVAGKTLQQVDSALVRCRDPKSYKDAEGTTKCFPYKIGQKLDGIDQYVWLHNNYADPSKTLGIKCPAGTGLDKCKYKLGTVCDNTKKGHQKLVKTQTCIPALSWENK